MIWISTWMLLTQAQNLRLWFWSLVLFCTFGAYWYASLSCFVLNSSESDVAKNFRLSFGFLNDPAQGIASAFQGGASATSYNTGLMFYWIFWVRGSYILTMTEPLILYSRSSYSQSTGQPPGESILYSSYDFVSYPSPALSDSSISLCSTC